MLHYSSGSLLQLTLSEVLLRKHNSSQRWEEKVSAAFIPAQTKVITFFFFFFFLHVLIKRLRIQSASFSGAFSRLELKKGVFNDSSYLCYLNSLIIPTHSWLFCVNATTKHTDEITETWSVTLIINRFKSLWCLNIRYILFPASHIWIFSGFLLLWH